MNNWKPIKNKVEIGNSINKVETYTLEGLTCSFKTCRHNKDGKCTSEEDRKICVDVAKKVLCVGESEEDGCNC